MYEVALLQHRESIWDKYNHFTGWLKVPLSGNLVGDDFVGLGLDCCDRLADFRKTPPNIGGTYDTIPDHSHLTELVALMIDARLSDGSIEKILGANFRRVYSEVIEGGRVRELQC